MGAEAGADAPTRVQGSAFVGPSARAGILPDLRPCQPTGELRRRGSCAQGKTWGRLQEESVVELGGGVQPVIGDQQPEGLPILRPDHLHVGEFADRWSVTLAAGTWTTPCCGCTASRKKIPWPSKAR